jgi:lysophospholipase L1-like esterase
MRERKGRRWAALRFWLLVIPSIPAAVWTRWRALRLDEAGGDRNGFSGERDAGHRPLALVGIGDSIIAGVGLAHIGHGLVARLAEALSAGAGAVAWRAHGHNGADIADLEAGLEAALDGIEPDVVLISIGVNDVTGLTSIRNWTTRLERLLNAIASRRPRALVVFAGLPPMERFPLLPQPLRTALGIRSAMIDEVAARVIGEKDHAIHVPMDIDALQGKVEMTFCEDGFHPDATGSAAWANHLAQIITARHEVARPS